MSNQTLCPVKACIIASIVELKYDPWNTVKVAIGTLEPEVDSDLSYFN